MGRNYKEFQKICIKKIEFIFYVFCHIFGQNNAKKDYFSSFSNKLNKINTKKFATFSIHFSSL